MTRSALTIDLFFDFGLARLTFVAVDVSVCKEADSNDDDDDDDGSSSMCRT